MSLRVVVVGAGAIGGWLAFRLAAAGHDVAVTARGAHLAAIRGEGLGLEEGGSVARISLDAGRDPAAFGPADLVVFGVKAHQLDAALAEAAPLAGPGTLALSTQNGVDAPERITGVFGEERTLIGVVRVSAEILRPGVIGEVVQVKGVTVGDMAGRQDRAASGVREALRAAGVKAPDAEDVRAELWSKFVLWNAASASVAARLSGNVAKASPEWRALSARLAREAVAVGRAAGAPVTDAMAETVERGLAEPPDPARANIRPSMLVDLEAGKPLELDHLVGAVARMGAELGVAVPASETVTAVLAPWRDGPPRAG